MKTTEVTIRPIWAQAGSRFEAEATDDQGRLHTMTQPVPRSQPMRGIRFEEACERLAYRLARQAGIIWQEVVVKVEQEARP